jgi:hypothetical protein
MFSNCKSLASISIPNGVTALSDYVFYECASLTSVTIPNGITILPNYTFYGCRSLSSVTIPNTVTEIGNGCFGMVGLTSVTIPNSVVKLGERPFVCHNMQSFSGKYASQDGKYLSEDGVMIAYAMSGLTSFVAPEEIRRIGPYCFNLCPSLTGITLHSGVTDVDAYCFCGATNLVSITLIATSNTISKTDGGYSRFKGSDTGTIYVPAGCSSGFRIWLANNWEGETWYKGKTSWVIEELP